jgi:hypothetical protein
LTGLVFVWLFHCCDRRVICVFACWDRL